jgi:uncharacterized protein
METQLSCPKCQQNRASANATSAHHMERIATPFGAVSRCIACKGLWIDALEHSDILKIAKTVDTGNDQIGTRNNAVDKIRCPCCPASQMLRMVDAKQPHIWYESCPTCHGCYFDAGELTDLSQTTLSDFIKKFTATERV